MKTILSQLRKLGAVALLLEACAAAYGQPVISSFSRNGELVCTNLPPGGVAAVEWASSVNGPWQTNWAGLNAVAVDSNGMIQVSVPMFYRVRSAPSGMALIPAGSFTMGDVADTNLLGDAAPISVTLSAFYMDQYDMTKAQWDVVCNWATNHGYSFDYAGSGKAADHPVQTVNWYDSVKWCNARSEKEGKTPAYYLDTGQTLIYRTGTNDLSASMVNWNAGYRLPTEAEWEKAARGGLSGKRFPWGNTIDESQANYYSTNLFTYDLGPYSGFNTNYATGALPYTSPVGSFAPNGYGLYDMAGNVWQWCWDWYGDYGSASQSDPRGPASGSARVSRGGSWGNGAIGCRSALRGYGLDPAFGYYYFGFRSVLPPGQ